jgi:hypothetical protein
MKHSIEKYSLMVIFHILLFLILFFAGCQKNGAEGIEEPEPTLPLVTVTADYTNVVSSYDKTKVLNVARGGHGINTDLTWMPGFYDKLVEIGVDEFRIDWLLSDWFYQVVSRDGIGELEYDFSRLDKIILPLAQKGIKPMMCMCYMASALGDNEGPPNDYNEYKATIKAYVQHYKDLGYTGWAWESHNEPEGFTNLTPAQTYKMYRYFSAAVKEVDPSARVGGYSSVGRDWMGYVNSFLDLYKTDSEKPVLDFFSFHQYGKPSWEYVPQIENAFEVAGPGCSRSVPDRMEQQLWAGLWRRKSGYCWRRIRYQYKCFVRGQKVLQFIQLSKSEKNILLEFCRCRSE